MKRLILLLTLLLICTAAQGQISVVSMSQGSSTAAGGSDTQIQYNSSNELAGDPNFLWQSADHMVVMGGSGDGGIPGWVNLFDFTADITSGFIGSWMEFYNSSGNTNSSDYMYGQYLNAATSNDTTGDIIAQYLYASATAGAVVGKTGVPRELTGQHIQANVGSGSTVNGNVYGTYIDLDNNGTVTGGYYGMYVNDDNGNINYSFYGEGPIRTTSKAVVDESLRVELTSHFKGNIAIGSGNVLIARVDTMKTASGVVRWFKLTTSDASVFWCPADTSIVK